MTSPTAGRSLGLFPVAGTFDSGVGGDDIIYAGSGGDTVLAGWGDDIVYGEDGMDSLDGGAGNDVLFGGADDDALRSRSHAESRHAAERRGTYSLCQIELERLAA